MAEPMAFPRRGLIPAIGDVVHFAGQRCIVQRHAHVWGRPTGLLLRILDGARAGMVTAADHTKIEIAPIQAATDPGAGATAPWRTKE